VLEERQLDLSRSDEFGQPLDMRPQNSWVQSIEEVSLLDCFSTQVINSIVPFHLISQLKSKMLGPSPSWIVNVSSMEGVFYRNYKSAHHPHTNMAKAALNMITRTCGDQLRAEGIFMNSVDTGWVTNENPFRVAKHMEEKHQFKCPLDCLDGAMRVLDPIYSGLLRKEFPHGRFLKDYKVGAW
jgi:NAD(P)-dependent dehydrogenase (short-subunit alcohol dehydrogenase family)